MAPVGLRKDDAELTAAFFNKALGELRQDFTTRWRKVFRLLMFTQTDTAGKLYLMYDHYGASPVCCIYRALKCIILKHF